jgi:ABC-type transport system involved in multi-copper enzyme maturation permease subunit
MITHLTDFPDKLSPMLVKELRQGLRARSFTMLFLIFQILLGFILLSSSAASSMDSAGSFASGVIFTMFGIAALFIQPMRGVTALSSEITGNTIEMMALTRLSASRIVLGKWIAIVSQTALILITIIPYLILRYFFGGMILLGELVFLSLIFLTSMALTAVMVGMSGTNAKLARILPVIGFIFMLQIIPAVLFRGGFNNFMSFCTLSDWESRVGILSYLCFITYLGWCALSHGISIIAPAAENHSTLRRLIALGLTCVAVAVGFHPSVDAHVPLLIFGIILAPAVITALTEPSNLLPPIYTPFLKRGLPGRLAAAFLLPGWPAGVFYSTLLLAVSTAGFLATARPAISPSEMTEIAIYTLAIVGGILLPALLAANFSKQESKRFTNFLVFLLASVILTIIPAIFANINNHENYLWLFIWNPPIFITMADESGFDKSQLLNAVMVVDGIILSLLLATAFIAFRGYREIIEEAERGLAHSTPAP